MGWFLPSNLPIPTLPKRPKPAVQCRPKGQALHHSISFRALKQSPKSTNIFFLILDCVC